MKKLGLTAILFALVSCGSDMNSGATGEPNMSHDSAEWQIWAYSTAAPDFIGDFATVKGGNGEVLKEGTNGWVCLPFNPMPENGFDRPHDANPACGDEASLAWVDAYMNQSESNFIKYASKQSRVSNAYKKWIGQDLGLRKKQAVGKKRSEEKKWVEKNPSNQLLLDKLFKLEEQKIKYQLAYSLFIELWYYGPEIIRFSNGIEKLKDAKEFESKIKNSYYCRV